MAFAEPLWLLLWPLIVVPMWVWYVRSPGAVRLPSLGILRQVVTRQHILRHAPFFCRCLAVTGVVLALARPYVNAGQHERTTAGLDIVLIVDTSRSMEARDYTLGRQRPTRLTVVKSVIGDFIKARPSDRIGMVIFGTEAFTQAPLTLDHEVLLRFLERVQIGMAGDATAIGDGLATAVNRLKDVPAKAKVAVLLTDGGNTAGRVDPLAAAEAAHSMGVKIYTIGVGTSGEVPVVVDGRTQAQKSDVDEDLLRRLADVTGGKYFAAKDTEALVHVYDTIDALEKTQIKVADYGGFDDRYGWFAGFGLVFLFAELGGLISRFRRIP